MSTKNLSRTAIEGGRTGWNCHARRASNRVQRALERATLARSRDPDLEDWVVPRRPQVWKDFRDKLSPPRRWLERQVGRPWRLVRGELLRKFDTRTTAGRHLIFDHMLSWVAEAHCPPGWRDFTIDRHGILRSGERWPRGRSPWARDPLPRPQDELVAWLSGRCVGARGDDLFWFVPTAWGAYRQHHRLADDDVALWRSLPEWFRACHDPSEAPGTIQVRLRLS